MITLWSGTNSYSLAQHNLLNKHTDSIAKAIKVPHLLRQIQICTKYFAAGLKKEQLELRLPCVFRYFEPN